MKRSILVIVTAIAMVSLTGNLFAQTTPRDTAAKKATAGTTTGAADSVKDVDATLMNVASLSTLDNAIKAANLNASLKGTGPFTVFAPDDAAFSTVSKSRLDSLMKDPAKLATLVNTHVVAGKYDKAALIGILKAHMADATKPATLTTVDGQTLTISVKDKKLAITDSRGASAQVTSFDTPATNGIIHGINAVLQ